MSLLRQSLEFYQAAYSRYLPNYRPAVLGAARSKVRDNFWHMFRVKVPLSDIVIVETRGDVAAEVQYEGLSFMQTSIFSGHIFFAVFYKKEFLGLVGDAYDLGNILTANDLDLILLGGNTL